LFGGICKQTHLILNYFLAKLYNKYLFFNHLKFDKFSDYPIYNITNNFKLICVKTLFLSKYYHPL
jgi:hypothetical protein